MESKQFRIMAMIAGWLAVLGAAGILATLLAGWLSQPATPVPTIPPCVAEDGGPYPCVWDGPSRGQPGNPGYRQGDRVVITEAH